MADSRALRKGRRRIRRQALDNQHSLSKRERDILACIVRGMSLKDAAAFLGVALSTADNHRTRMMRRIDAHTSVEVVLWALDRGIIASRYNPREHEPGLSPPNAA